MFVADARLSAGAGRGRGTSGAARRSRVQYGDPATATFADDVFGVYVQSPDDHGALVDVAPHRRRVRRRSGRTSPSAPTCCRSPSSRRPASRAPTSSSARRSGSACRSATADRMRRSSPRARPSCARRRGASSASRSTAGAGARTGWRCRRASSTSGARRRRRTSARRRRCWPTWRRSTACIHGPDGLRAHCRRIHDQAVRLAQALEAGGWRQINDGFFDTLRFEVAEADIAEVRRAAEARGINFRYPAPGRRADVAERDGRPTPTWRDIIAAFGGEPRGAPGRRGQTVSADSRPAAADVGVPDASGVQLASLRDRDDALHPVARAQGPRPRHGDDPARVVHDEAQRGGRDDAGELAGVLADASRSCRSIRRQATGRSSTSSTRRSAAITGLPGGVAAAELGRAGRVRGAARHSRPTISRAATSAATVALIPQSAHGTNPGERRHGRHVGRDRRVRRPTATSTSTTCGRRPRRIANGWRA